MKQNAQFQLNYDYPDGPALAARFPYMFNKPHIDFSFYRGWQPILSGVCVAVDTALTAELGPAHKRFAWVQIKEKFGSARLHYHLSRPRRKPPRIILPDGSPSSGQTAVDWDALTATIRHVVDAAESATMNACMACGVEAKRDCSSGWTTTLCSEHRAWLSDDTDSARIQAFWNLVTLPGVPAAGVWLAGAGR